MTLDIYQIQQKSSNTFNQMTFKLNKHKSEGVRPDRYQIEAGVCPSKKPGHGMSGSLGPRRILSESGFGWTWVKQDSG